MFFLLSSIRYIVPLFTEIVSKPNFVDGIITEYIDKILLICGTIILVIAILNNFCLMSKIFGAVRSIILFTKRLIARPTHNSPFNPVKFD